MFAISARVLVQTHKLIKKDTMRKRMHLVAALAVVVQGAGRFVSSNAQDECTFIHVCVQYQATHTSSLQCYGFGFVHCCVPLLFPSFLFH